MNSFQADDSFSAVIHKLQQPDTNKTIAKISF